MPNGAFWVSVVNDHWKVGLKVLGDALRAVVERYFEKRHHFDEGTLLHPIGRDLPGREGEAVGPGVRSNTIPIGE